jgi:predicted permease
MMACRPPEWLEWVIERVTPRHSREYVLGDLAEEYRRVLAESGAGRARSWYAGEVVRAIGVALLKLVARGVAEEVGAGDGASAAGRRSMMAGQAQESEVIGRGGRGGLMRRWVDGLVLDGKHAWRGLARRPVATLAAVAALALAIGANAATFGVVDHVLLRPMPYAGAERIVSISELHGERMQEPGWASVPNYLDWRAQARSFESVAVFRGRSMAVTGGGEPQYVYGVFASPTFFQTFAAEAGVGRALRAGDDESRSPPVVVLSHAFWMRRYGGDASVIGRTVNVDGEARIVVGVMPAGFNAPGEWIDARLRIDVWIPFVIDAAGQPRDSRSFNVVARLRPGVSLSDAATELTVISGRLQRAYPVDNQDWETRLFGWKEMVVGYTRRVLLPLWAAMGLVLVVACANVGNLMLNRSLARSGELATRAALGAGRGQLLRPATAEAWLIALAGTVLGGLVAAGLLSAVRALDPGDLPRLASATLDVRALAGTALAGLLVALLLSVLPALQARRGAVSDTLRAASSRTGGTRGARRARDLLATLQLALALALLAGSSLALRGFLLLRNVSPGFDATGVLTATVALSWARVPEPARRAAFTAAVLDQLRAIPGVRSAGMINSLPFSGSHAQQTFAIAGVPQDPDRAPFAGMRAISPGYMATMRIPLRGRDFTAADLTGPTAAVVVNETLVRRYFPDGDAIGQKLILQNSTVTAEIVGVAGDIRHFSLEEAPRPEVYLPYSADFLTSKSFVVRTDGDPLALAPAVRAAILRVDPLQPLRATGPEGGETIPMQAMIRASLSGARFHTLVLVVLAALAVVLSMIGLFAVAAMLVTERAREIGVRMALGAEPRRVLSWILARGARMLAAGMLAGAVLLLIAGRALEALVFGLSPRDPLTLLSASAAFLLTAVVALLTPARRATRIDPARVLRQD